MNRAHATREAWHPQTKQDREAILHELEAVLASPHFCNSKRYPTLLRHIVENTLEGRVDLLKERTLGVEVFDRPPTYDTNSDTVVRYTAGEVRKRLLLYYSEHQSSSGIKISLPAGSYVAEFLHEHDELDYGGSESDLHTAEPYSVEAAPHRVGYPGGETDEAALVPFVEGETPAHSAAGVIAPGRIPAATKRLWWAGALVLLLVAVAAGVMWKLRPPGPQTPLDAFWSPVIHDQHTVIVCTGSSVFAPQRYSGVATADKNIDYPFVSMQTASAIAQVSSAMERFGAATQLSSAPTTTLPDLREHSVVLLGGYNNQWTLRFVDPLRFHFIQNRGAAEIIADRLQPQTQWERDSSLPYSSADDYALVARFRDPTIDGWVMVLAGLGRNGTEAAAEFATSQHYLQQLKDRLGSGFASRNVEVVLRVNVIEGKTGAPSILTVHSW